jgi:hypothetical protein
MGFSARNEKAARLVRDVAQMLWASPVIQDTGPYFHEPYGYEALLSHEAQDVLRRRHDATADHIRFAPDFVLVYPNRRNNRNVLLLEYKVTTTPRYTFKEEQWDFGQIEADSWENDLQLSTLGIAVALIIYCPYHSRPILCDFVKPELANTLRRQVQSTYTGSSTDYVNIHLKSMRTLGEFLSDELGIPYAISAPIITSMKEGWLRDSVMHTSHATGSTYKERITGFNWE